MATTATRKKAATKTSRSTSAICSFGEPWTAKREVPPPPLEGEEPKPESKLSWHVWAKVCPGIRGEYTSLTSAGEIIECDDTWPILAFRQNAAIQLPGLNAEALAKRVAACINFCAGVDLEAVGHPTLRELIRSIDDPDAQSRREVNSIWPISQWKSPDQEK